MNVAKTEELREELREAQRKRDLSSQVMDQIGVAIYDAQIADIEANIKRSETLAGRSQSQSQSKSSKQSSQSKGKE